MQNVLFSVIFSVNIYKEKKDYLILGQIFSFSPVPINLWNEVSVPLGTL